MGNLSETSSLLGRLIKYMPREGQTPLENFCTEVLAHALQESKLFRTSFLKTLGWSAMDKSEICTQIQNSEGESTCRYDLKFKCSDEVRVVEVKVDSPPNEDQLKRYAGQLSISASKPNKSTSVGLLSRFSPSFKWEKKLLWRDVLKLAGKAAKREDPSSKAHWLLDDICNFLKEKIVGEKAITKVNATEDFLDLADSLIAMMKHFKNGTKNIGSWSRDKKRSSRIGLLPSGKRFYVQGPALKHPKRRTRPTIAVYLSRSGITPAFFLPKPKDHVGNVPEEEEGTPLDSKVFSGSFEEQLVKLGKRFDAFLSRYP